MKSTAVAVLAALWARHAAAHATFQQLWVDGVDYGSQCARLPASNSPVTDVTSTNMRCNAGASRPGGKCPVKAGSTVTVEMHQVHPFLYSIPLTPHPILTPPFPKQNGDRACANEAIGGAHYGPLMVYMTKVSDAASADGSTGWFKIFQDGWAKNPSGASGDDDYWGTKDLNKCCGRISVKIPSDIPAGDYLLRAEVIALHTAGSSGGAQLYMTCYQITVSGGGSATPSPTVNFPGAYKASDPGILVNIHAALATYVVPGPAVYSGGSTRSAGAACSGCESTCSPGSAPGVTLTATAPASTGTAGSGGGACEAQKYQQCGGTGYTGCTVCAVSSSLNGFVVRDERVLTRSGTVGFDL